MPRDPNEITELRIPVLKPSDLVVEASPRRVYANAHTYHINSISVNSDGETYLSADDLRINLWHVGINGQSFSILVLICINIILYSSNIRCYVSNGSVNIVSCLTSICLLKACCFQVKYIMLIMHVYVMFFVA